MAYNSPKKLGSVVTQVFTGSGTYTPTTGMVNCIIECVGGGGAGGSVGSAAAGYFVSAAGGGGGGYARKYSTASAIGANQTVTVGTGGTPGAAGANPGGNGADTSVGSICIGKGGTGGGSNTGGGTYPAGGAGGVAGTGDLTFPGRAGEGGPVDVFTDTTRNSSGGSSYFGAGAPQGVTATQSDGATGSVYGGGGSGATSRNAGANQAGGAGAAGVVIITEYIQ